ncbi:unnamed protein product, partial [Brassica rapa subsp. trilocularis]
ISHLSITNFSFLIIANQSFSFLRLWIRFSPPIIIIQEGKTQSTCHTSFYGEGDVDKMLPLIQWWSCQYLIYLTNSKTDCWYWAILPSSSNQCRLWLSSPNIRRSLSKPHVAVSSRRHLSTAAAAATATSTWDSYADESGIVMKRSSNFSACTSVSLEPSYVLRALGVDEDMSHTSIRFGIGRFTTEEEIDKPVRAYG